MKKQCCGKKKYMSDMVIFMLLLCFAVTACGIQDGLEGVAIQGGSSSTGRDSSTDDSKDEDEDDVKKVQIYTMDPDSLEAEQTVVEIETPDGLTPQLIVDAVGALFEVQGQPVGIIGVEQEESTVTVNFDSAQPPVSGVGSAEETAILDCISMSLLDNLDNCQQVVFRVDGDAYQSGHYGFDYNEAYKWKN